MSICIVFLLFSTSFVRVNEKTLRFLDEKKKKKVYIVLSLAMQSQRERAYGSQFKEQFVLPLAYSVRVHSIPHGVGCIRRIITLYIV